MLISEDDNDIAEVTYIHEGDLQILYFEGNFIYGFYYNEDIGYEHCKSKSTEILGYESEDKTIFCLNKNLFVLIENRYIFVMNGRVHF